YRVQRKDGTWMWVRDRAAQKYDLEGESYFDGKLSDVTEQKLMERGLKGYVEHLEQMVKDLKTYSMKLEEMVKERNQLLVDAERNVAVGQVASMVGHDLRGPLQTINNAIYLLKNHPEKQDELVQTVQGAVRYAVKILEDLRTATRDSPLEVELVNLTALIMQALGEAPLPERITVSTQFAEGLEGVYLDIVKIRRALDNLIRNACEAIEGEGTLTVRAYREGGEAVIEVADTGVGIPEEFLPNLFQTFKTTKRKGLGLGLAYTKKAVEAHGGRVAVESVVGEGTVFRVSIPQPRVESGAEVGAVDVHHPVERNMASP
ncbi:hypothetical protein JXL21_01820, partial [Candidatus Bathyarchaeota archaeon]|nr:hypothetical protein [Candidatus Bathyarchaeota archaeon]